MAHELNIQLVFGSPFSAEPFSLGRFADRAISLLSVNSIIVVAARAMRFLRVDIGARSAVALGVFANSDALEMLRVNASAISANVVNDHTLWQIAVSEEPRHAVRATIQAAKKESAVSIFVQRSLPNVAVSNFDCFKRKPIVFFVSAVHFLTSKWNARHSTVTMAIQGAY
jgi:hypothetical protein